MITKTFMQAAALVTSCLLFSVSDAGAYAIDISSAPGADLQFNGNSTFQFDDSGAGIYSGFDFTVSLDNGSNSGAAVGLLGNISGLFTLGTVVGDSAPVSGTGSFSIWDGTGGVPTAANTLTATLNWVNAFASGTGGTLNFGGTVNLFAIAYTGANTSLLALASITDGSSNGVATVSFQASDVKTLTYYKTNVDNSSYSGSINTTVPDGGATAALMGLGFVGVGLLGRRMKLAVA
jgi:hypothetical protein